MHTFKISRDNLFNIATCALSFFSIIISQAFELKPMGDIAPFIIFIALSSMNKVNFKKGRFFNSQGVDISSNLPNKLSIWMPLVFIGFFILAFNDIINPWSDFLSSLFVSMLSYFIFKGCPMSILLNQKAWKMSNKVFGFKPRYNCYQQPQYMSGIKSTDIYNDPTYSGFSCNTHNYHHWHRH